MYIPSDHLFGEFGEFIAFLYHFWLLTAAFQSLPGQGLHTHGNSLAAYRSSYLPLGGDGGVTLQARSREALPGGWICTSCLVSSRHCLTETYAGKESFLY